MKKITALFLTLVLVLCTVLALPLGVSAESTAQQDGLEVTISTDKTAYTADEDIRIVVKIKNTNSSAVEDISVETLLPDGLELKEGDKTTTGISVPAGGTCSVLAIARLADNSTPTEPTESPETKPTETESEKETVPSGTPDTGDSFNLILWLSLLAASAAVIAIVLVIKFKKAAKALCLFLCLVMVASMLPLSTNAAVGNVTITVDTAITVGDKAFTIESKVSYVKPSVEPDDPDDTVGSTYTVSFDLNYEGATGTPEAQVVNAGETATMPNNPTRDGYIFTGWYNDVEYSEKFDFTQIIVKSCTLFARWVNMTDTTDTDGDGLTNSIEEYYGTDSTVVDTDADGLSDYIEVAVLGYDPLSNDTDKNGTLDGQEDHDRDGLNNRAECDLGTNPSMADTDWDNLTDGDEKNIYGTNPLLEDTDGDGVYDGKEVELGTNPLVAESTFSVNITADNEDSVKASVDINLAGEQVETLQVEAVDNDTLFPAEMPGYMGQAYDFNVSGSFDSATLSFEFDSALVGSADFEPTVYYYNESTGLLEALPTEVNGNVASATVTHFSTYILINRVIYEKAFTWQDTWDSEQQYTNVELVLVVDDSGSMTSNDPNYERLNVARTLVDKLPDNSKIGLVRFDGDWPKTEALTEELTTDKETVKNYLTRTYFYSPGGTDMYNGINLAFPLFESAEATTLKMIVVLSDGETSDIGKHSAVIQTANEKGIKIYTVGLGTGSTSYFNNYLKPLANNTGGAFYLASNATALAAIYNDISERIDLSADSDEDGIPDYYEDNMVLFNGVKIQLDKNNPDTDGDDVPDGEEVKLVITHYDENGNIVEDGGVKVVVKGTIIADPLVKDTDGDGYYDDVDNNPTVPYKTPIILLHGLHSNTGATDYSYGVTTRIKPDMNYDYGSEVTKTGNLSYTDCESHEIISVTPGRLGAYLMDEMDYEPNKNLFAFNYPNRDMVHYNALKLSRYISDLLSTAVLEDVLNEYTDAVDEKYLFATKADKENRNVKFILIGHSMGGLVSRYYIENIGTTHVDRLITIDTPHYGSGMANSSDALADIFNFSPAVIDLDTKSMLFGGNEKERNFQFGGLFNKVSNYAISHQSPALNGNQNVSVPYYAIGGYDVGVALERCQLADELRNTCFGFEFDRNISSKDDYKNSINIALSDYSYDLYNTFSELDLGNSDGDNTVDYMSQFAVRFDGEKIDDFQKLERTFLVVNTKIGPYKKNPFHNIIFDSPIMHKAVADFIND